MQILNKADVVGPFQAPAPTMSSVTDKDCFFAHPEANCIDLERNETVNHLLDEYRHCFLMGVDAIMEERKAATMEILNMVSHSRGAPLRVIS